eukprot:15578620-Heterocapsa_arctica.AAC.1
MWIMKDEGHYVENFDDQCDQGGAQQYEVFGPGGDSSMVESSEHLRVSSKAAGSWGQGEGWRVDRRELP